jgi:hypothetical protein
MPKRALIVGIDQYDQIALLGGCVNDAAAIEEVIARNGDRSLNFDCRLLTSPGPEAISFSAKSLTSRVGEAPSVGVVLEFR